MPRAPRPTARSSSSHQSCPHTPVPPFRSFLVSIPQLIGSLGGAPAALPLEQVETNLAVNAGAIALFAFFFRQDWKVGAGRRAWVPWRTGAA